MSFIELISKRYSVRAYKPLEVEDEKLQTVLEAARLAPTACNLQPFKIIVINTAGKEEQLLSIYKSVWFVQAPIILCICGDTTTAWVRKDGRKYLDVDVAIAMDYITLAATDLGLGTCFIAAFNAENARQVLAIPEEIEPILFTPLGYPDDTPGIKKRKSLDELINYDHW
jgi:nitroreductase